MFSSHRFIYKKKKKINSFVLAGGVASNKFIRKNLPTFAQKKVGTIYCARASSLR